MMRKMTSYPVTKRKRGKKARNSLTEKSERKWKRLLSRKSRTGTRGPLLILGRKLLRRKAPRKRARRRRRPRPRKKPSPRRKPRRKRARPRKRRSARNAEVFLAEDRDAGPCALLRALAVPRFFLRDAGFFGFLLFDCGAACGIQSPASLFPGDVFRGGVDSGFRALMQTRLVC